MSVLSTLELGESRSGAWTTDQGRSYNRVFRVVTNNPFDGPNVAIQAVGIQRGDQYFPTGSDANLEVDLFAYAHTMSAAAEEGDGLGWIVTIEYGPYSALWAGGGPKQNPLFQPIDVKWSMRSQEMVCSYDINGNAILNTVNDPYDPPLMHDEPRPVLTVTRNEQTWNQALQVQYFQAVSSDPFAGYVPLMARVLDINSNSVFHQDVGWYYQAVYEFEFKPPLSSSAGQNGYRDTVVNQGMRVFATANTPASKYHFTFKGVPVTEPVLINQDGTVNLTGKNPYFNVYQTRPELPFAIFQFDPNALIGQRSGFESGYGPPFFGNG
jgi:hypothetical protein